MHQHLDPTYFYLYFKSSGKVQSDAGRGQHKEKAFVRAIQMWKLGLVLRKYPGPCP